VLDGADLVCDATRDLPPPPVHDGFRAARQPCDGNRRTAGGGGRKGLAIRHQPRVTSSWRPRCRQRPPDLIGDTETSGVANRVVAGTVHALVLLFEVIGPVLVEFPLLVKARSRRMASAPARLQQPATWLPRRSPSSPARVDAPEPGRHCGLIAYVVLASEHRDGLW
jgi:hypothetical protein